MFTRTLVVGCLSAALSATALGQTCTINFDTTCPSDTSAECGAFFDGLGGCVFAGLPFCYDTGTMSYLVNDANPLVVRIPEGMSELTTFFANTGAASGQMRFFDAEVGGNEVGTPVDTNGDCLLAMPARQTQAFTTPVRRVEVTAVGGDVYVDTFEITPVPIAPTVSSWGMVTFALLTLTAGTLAITTRRRFAA